VARQLRWHEIKYYKHMEKNKKLIYILAGLAVLTLIIVASFVWKNYQFSITPKTKPISGQTMTEKEARMVAEKTCIKGGEALSSGSYNEITKTWWFDANLNATREGCNPACVVSEETKTAEINWRCTGLIPPDQSKPNTPPTSDQCGIENCHGLDIVCGKKPAEMCTMMYQLGDRCRQYAQCGQVNGKCQQIENPLFTACKSCAKKCEKDFPNDPDKAFACESKCGE